MLPEPFIRPDDDFFEPNRRLKIHRHFDPTTIRKILIRGIDPLGDLAIGSAFYRETRRLFPQAHITVLVSTHAAEYLRYCPYVDEVRVFDKNRQFELIGALRRDGYDLSLLLTGNLRAALIVWLAGIPNRVGFDTDGRGTLLTVRLSWELHHRYRGENHFDLLRALGLSPQNVFGREVWLSEIEKERARSILIDLQLQGEPVAFNPFARVANRRWAPDNWQRLLRTLRNRGMQPVMFIGPGEQDMAQVFLEQMGMPDIPVMQHDLLTTAALLEQMEWAIGTDSGFIHLALAVNKPHVIAIYGLLPPVSSFPIHDRRHQALIARLPCTPCYLYKASDRCFNENQCMKMLTHQDVLEAMEAVRARSE